MPGNLGRKKAVPTTRAKNEAGRVPPETLAMLTMGHTTVFLSFKLEDGHPDLFMHQKGKVLKFSDLTSHDLDAYKVFLDCALQVAEQVVKKLDDNAEEAMKRGQRDFYRIFRTLPVLAIRRRLFPQHFESVQGRPWTVHNLDGGVAADPLGLAGNRVSSRKMVDRVQATLLDTDLEQTLSEPEGDSEVDGADQLLGYVQSPDAGPSEATPDT